MNPTAYRHPRGSAVKEWPKAHAVIPAQAGIQRSQSFALGPRFRGRGTIRHSGVIPLGAPPRE
jgi:hypothetical protein